MELNIDYFSGAGNLFTAIDNKNYRLKKDDFAKFAEILSSENSVTKVKTEGIIVLNPAENADFDVWFFNPDGTSGMMCGNGGRCAIKFALLQNYLTEGTKKVSFSMNDKLYSGTLNENDITIFFQAPTKISNLIKITIDDKEIEGRYVDVGTDHFVVKTNEINEIDIIDIGKKIRFHQKFAPLGVNANFYSLIDENILQIRTYERGVEAETAACGTGAIATALTYHKISNKSKIKLIPKSSSVLEVEIFNENNYIKKISLKGMAEKIGENTISI